MLLTEDSPRIEQPTSIPTPLFEHQKSLVAKMTDLEQTHSFQYTSLTFYQSTEVSTIKVDTGLAILGDRVGSGKTLTLVALLDTSPPPTPWCSYLRNSNNYVLSKRIHTIPATSNLILVPTSLISQWRNTLELSSLTHYVFHSTKSIRDFLLAKHTVHDFQVVLVSSTFQKAFSDKIAPPVRWNRVIIDEVTFSVYRGLMLEANFIWLVTATPYSSEVRRGMYVSRLLDHLSYSFINQLLLQNEDSFIEKSVSLPPYITHTIACETPTELAVFHDAIPTATLDLLNAGCIKEAICTLNCEVHTEESVLKVLTDQYHKQVHNLNARRTYIQSLEIPEDDRKKRLEKIATSMGEVQTKIDGIRERVMSLNTKMCPVCMDSLKEPMITPCCSNAFCGPCILTALSHTSACPYCRTDIHAKDLCSITDSVPPPSTDTVPTLPKKPEAIRDFLQKRETHQRVLVFSKYDASFREICKTLEESNIAYKMLKGSGIHIQKLLSEYSEGKHPVLLLNAQYMGAGLNLEMTTDLILYHSLEEDLENQVVGRAQRPGRTCPLNIYQLRYANEGQ